MKNEVELFELNQKVTFEENNVMPVLLNNGDRYDSAVITDDGRLIAYDDAVCNWVQLGTEEQEGYTFIDSDVVEI